MKWKTRIEDAPVEFILFILKTIIIIVILFLCVCMYVRMCRLLTSPISTSQTTSLTPVATRLINFELLLILRRRFFFSVFSTNRKEAFFLSSNGFKTPFGWLPDV
jgi:hypothetical protein